MQDLIEDGDNNHCDKRIPMTGDQRWENAAWYINNDCIEHGCCHSAAIYTRDERGEQLLVAECTEPDHADVICAAPNMLATLERILRSCRAKQYTDQDASYLLGVIEDEACAAIAKATGGTMITAADQASASSPEPSSPEPTSSEQGGR